jgi:hypothetical protein
MSDGAQGAGPGDNGGEGSVGQCLGGSEHDESLAADSVGEGGAHGAYAVETPERMLGEAKAVRRRTRSARHAYWFPLVVFGLLALASSPFYIQHIPTKRGVYVIRGAEGPAFLHPSSFDGFGILHGRVGPYYWLGAILVGVAATAVWYRWRGDRVGLRTPVRGYVLTGLALLVLALGIPALTSSAASWLAVLMSGDMVVRGTFPLVIIGIGLCYLAWAERSLALSLIAAGYLGLSLVTSLYDIENILYRLGWSLGPDVSGLPNVVLPALVLLLAGAGAWVVQHRYGPLAPEPAEEQTA